MWEHVQLYQWELGDQAYMLEHGYIGNDSKSGENPAYEDEAFCDARQEESGDRGERAPEVTLPIGRMVSGYKEIPAFTNYAIDFCATLDYVWVSGLEPVRAAPMPSREFLAPYGAMPNASMPSDHVSLVCELVYTV